MKNKVIQYALTHNISLPEAFEHFNISKNKETFIRSCKRFLKKRNHGGVFIESFLKKGSAKNKKIKALLVCAQTEIKPLVINNEQALSLVKQKIGQQEYELLYNKIYRENPKIAKSITSQQKEVNSPCTKKPFDLHEYRFI